MGKRGVPPVNCGSPFLPKGRPEYYNVLREQQRVILFRNIVGKVCLVLKEVKYVIQDENGIHARPAGMLVKEAQQFASAITITCGQRSADLKKLFALMKMGVKKGEEITLQVEGADEAEAAPALEAFLKENF